MKEIRLRLTASNEKNRKQMEINQMESLSASPVQDD